MESFQTRAGLNTDIGSAYATDLPYSLSDLQTLNKSLFLSQNSLQLNFHQI